MKNHEPTALYWDASPKQAGVNAPIPSLSEPSWTDDAQGKFDSDDGPIDPRAA